VVNVKAVEQQDAQAVHRDYAGLMEQRIARSNQIWGLLDRQQVEPALEEAVSIRELDARQGNWGASARISIVVQHFEERCRSHRPDIRERSNLPATERITCKRGGVHIRTLKLAMAFSGWTELSPRHEMDRVCYTFIQNDLLLFEKGGSLPLTGLFGELPLYRMVSICKLAAAVF
jgi:hypothetical protein